MNIETKKINVGIGFVTGRKNFKDVVKSYLDNWRQSVQADRKKYALHLFVAYDLKYMSTNANDYQMTENEILGSVDSTHYLGSGAIANEARELVEQKVLSQAQARLLFGEGYAMKRNAVLYFALKCKMDYLIFLDDDEYPVANIRVDNSIVWKGQEVLSAHIQNLQYCDMTHGHHCGYISPIPSIKFNELFKENDFQMLMDTLSNDIVTWDSIKEKLSDGGVTFAQLAAINKQTVEEVAKVGGMKFISGANLGFNLKNLDKIFPFYNPPGARGEDTFMSTCISACIIRKVPCYTFHDAYSAYHCLLSGVLPNRLKSMTTDTSANYTRFLKACIGWIRYKPLLLYITAQTEYSAQIDEMKKNLSLLIPKLCTYFKNEDFQVLCKELDFYHAHVAEHFEDFQATKNAWLKVVERLKPGQPLCEKLKRKVQQKEKSE